MERVVIRVDPAVYGTLSETLWAEHVGDNRYRLCNIPFFAPTVSMGDVVFAPRDQDGIPTFERVVEKSGNRTVRFALEEPDDNLVIDELQSRGCGLESFGNHIFSANVPVGTCLECVIRLLDDAEVPLEISDPPVSELPADVQ